MFYHQLHYMEAETANPRISIMIATIIRLKLTVDVVDTMDFSWEAVPSTLWV